MDVSQPHVPPSLILDGPGDPIASEKHENVDSNDPGSTDCSANNKKYEIVRKFVDQYFKHERQNLQDYILHSAFRVPLLRWLSITLRKKFKRIW